MNEWIMNLKPSLSTALCGRGSFAMKQAMDFVIFFARSQLCGSFSKWWSVRWSAGRVGAVFTGLSNSTNNSGWCLSRWERGFEVFLKYFTRCNICKSHESCQALSYPGRVERKVRSVSKWLLSKTAEAVGFLFLHPPYFSGATTNTTLHTPL